MNTIKSESANGNGGSRCVQRVVSQHKCDRCMREGRLVSQHVIPRQCTGWNQYVDKPWVFRYYLCQWHQAAWNRRKISGQTPLRVVEYVPDETLLANVESSQAAPDVRHSTGVTD